MRDQPAPVRRTIQDRTIYFRLSAHLADAAASVAEREGMTVSELVRHALRRELREAA